MKKRIGLLAFLCLLLLGCDSRERQCGIMQVDLDSLQPLDVNFAHEYVSHKIFDTPGRTDTLHVSENLVSIKKATSIMRSAAPEQSGVHLSRVELYCRDKIIFRLDSVLTTGMYCYDENSKLLTIPIVLAQNPDDFRTENDIYLCQIETGHCLKINENPLFNSSFALICLGGKYVIYSDANILYAYEIATKKSMPVVEFSNPLLSIFKMDCRDGKLGVYYFQDFVEDSINDRPLQKVEIPMPEGCYPFS